MTRTLLRFQRYSKLQCCRLRQIRPFLVIVVFLLFFGCSSSPKTYESVRGQDLILHNGDKWLFWFSGIHSNDPNSLMFEDIENSITRFLPSIVFVEGGYNASHFDTDMQARLSGESAYTAFISEKKNIPCVSIEPTDLDINNYLTRAFSSESILAMYILRQMRQKQREAANAPIDYDDYFLQFTLQQIAKGLLTDTGRTNLVAELIDPYVGYHVDRNNWLKVDTFALIYTKGSLLHEIWQETYDFRNRYILESIGRAFQKQDRVFVMMGFDHARDLAVPLEELVKNLTSE